jgi:hypothetical protein
MAYIIVLNPIILSSARCHRPQARATQLDAAWQRLVQ